MERFRAAGAALGALIGVTPAITSLAVTMTGEFCDAFHMKAEGVRQILSAAQNSSANRKVIEHLTGSRLDSIAAQLVILLGVGQSRLKS